MLIWHIAKSRPNFFLYNRNGFVNINTAKTGKAQVGGLTDLHPIKLTNVIE